MLMQISDLPVYILDLRRHLPVNILDLRRHASTYPRSQRQDPENFPKLTYRTTKPSDTNFQNGAHRQGEVRYVPVDSRLITLELSNSN